jgi:hypothetical protein
MVASGESERKTVGRGSKEERVEGEKIGEGGRESGKERVRERERKSKMGK